MARDNTWTNSDGLYVGFGTRTVQHNNGSKVSLGGLRQQIVMKIKATELNDAATADELAHAVSIPGGAELRAATLVVNDAFTTSASGTLDIGLYAADANGTTDDDGIDVALAAATLIADAVVACDGAKVTTILDAPYKVYATYDTGVFTAGEATLVIDYILPAA